MRSLFEQHLARGLHPAAQLAIYAGRDLVADLAGGAAGPDTLFAGFSCGKPLAAACLWVLRDRGLLDWDDPVARYWPEFAANGKSGVTIDHVLTHRAGLPTLPESAPWQMWTDWEGMTSVLERMAPAYPPGTAIQYHEITFGWLVGAIVERISGCRFRDFFMSEVAAPLDLNDTYFGLPPELEPRVARVEAMPGFDPVSAALWINLPGTHQAVIPAANVITTARDLARFYSALVNGGHAGTRRWLGEDTVSDATRVRAEGPDRGSGEPQRRTLGMSSPAAPIDGMGVNANRRAFGHSGMATSVSWGDPDLGVAMAYLTSGMQPAEINLKRRCEMSQAVREAFGAEK